MRIRYRLWRAVAGVRWLPRRVRVPIMDKIATLDRRSLGFMNPGGRPLYDGNAPLTAAERAEYRAHSRIFGLLDDRVDAPDEGPDQPEPGIAVGEQRRADVE